MAWWRCRRVPRALVEIRRAGGGQLDARQTQPESPSAAWQLLDRTDRQLTAASPRQHNTWDHVSTRLRRGRLTGDSPGKRLLTWINMLVYKFDTTTRSRKGRGQISWFSTSQRLIIYNNPTERQENGELHFRGGWREEVGGGEGGKATQSRGREQGGTLETQDRWTDKSRTNKEVGQVLLQRAATGRQQSARIHSQSCGWRSDGRAAAPPRCRSGCVPSASAWPRRQAPPPNGNPATPLAAELQDVSASTGATVAFTWPR